MALIVLERRLVAYLVPPMSLTPVLTRSSAGPALSLLPLVRHGIAPAGPLAPPNPFASVDFGPEVRTISYRGTFRASQAMEGADGNLYISYYWPPPGPIAYDQDRLGIVSGGAIREIMAGDFLDLLTITGNTGGYPTFTISNGTTPTGGKLHGTWLLDATGVVRQSNAEPSYVECRLCDVVSGLSSGRVLCAGFAQGELCEWRDRITYSVRGRPLLVIRGVHLIGAGRHRFLISAFDANDSGLWDLEGFAR